MPGRRVLLGTRAIVLSVVAIVPPIISGVVRSAVRVHQILLQVSRASETLQLVPELEASVDTMTVVFMEGAVDVRVPLSGRREHGPGPAEGVEVLHLLEDLLLGEVQLLVGVVPRPWR